MAFELHELAEACLPDRGYPGAVFIPQRQMEQQVFDAGDTELTELPLQRAVPRLLSGSEAGIPVIESSLLLSVIRGPVPAQTKDGVSCRNLRQVRYSARIASTSTWAPFGSADTSMVARVEKAARSIST